MENLNYRILPLCEDDLLADAMVDMQLAVRQGGFYRREEIDEKDFRPEASAYLSPADESGEDDAEDEDEEREGLYDSRRGRAVVGLGLNLTPAETPRS